MQNKNVKIFTDDIDYNQDIEKQTLNSSKCFGDIDTGTAYLKAKKTNILQTR
jgi:hypothetical protein